MFSQESDDNSKENGGKNLSNNEWFQNSDDDSSIGSQELNQDIDLQVEESTPAEIEESGSGIQIPEDTSPPSKKRKRWPLFTLAGLTILVLIAFASGFSGYSQGLLVRQNAESTQVVLVVQEQYQLGLQELEQKQYERARQRFEYVIQLNPSYPGATDRLAEVLLRLNATATPTIIPTPTLSPTPDTRNEEQLFNQGTQFSLNGDWQNAIETLLNLRQANPEYRQVEIDGMLYLALRNQGVDKILKEADLEGGIYDLSLAANFGPLDAQADSYKNFASFYITGASFWEIDWGQASYYFSQVAPHLPNLMDGSKWTASERYRLSLIGYAEQLFGNKNWCQSAENYRIALSISYDPAVEQSYNKSLHKCEENNKPPDEEGTPPDQNP